MRHVSWFFFFFFQAEDGIRDLVRSRGLGDVYKRQGLFFHYCFRIFTAADSCATLCDRIRKSGYRRTSIEFCRWNKFAGDFAWTNSCLLYTSDAADERSSVDLGGRRIIKKKNRETNDIWSTVKKKKNEISNYVTMS